MTTQEFKETVKRMDVECDKLDRAIARAKARFDSALFDLCQAERAHAAACQRRTAFEGRHDDLGQHPWNGEAGSRDYSINFENKK